MASAIFLLILQCSVAGTAFDDRFLRICGEGRLRYSLPTRIVQYPITHLTFFADNPEPTPAACSESHAYARGQWI